MFFLSRRTYLRIGVGYHSTLLTFRIVSTELLHYSNRFIVNLEISHSSMGEATSG